MYSLRPDCIFLYFDWLWFSVMASIPCKETHFLFTSWHYISIHPFLEKKLKICLALFWMSQWLTAPCGQAHPDKCMPLFSIELKASLPSDISKLTKLWRLKSVIQGEIWDQNSSCRKDLCLVTCQEGSLCMLLPAADWISVSEIHVYLIMIAVCASVMFSFWQNIL